MQMDGLEILPGATDYLQHLRGKDIRTAVGSASKNAPLILERLNISGLFDVIVDGNTVAKAKPDPDVFLRAARELGTAPASCVVFEDAEAGIEAARRAGMGAVGIGNADTIKQADILLPDLFALVVIAGF